MSQVTNTPNNEVSNVIATNVKEVTNKKETTKKNTPKKEKEVRQLVSINLSKFTDKLKNVKTKEIKKKEHLYVYPENYSELMINGSEGKQFRNKCRSKLNRYCNNISSFASSLLKTKDIEFQNKLQNEIKLFMTFYKETYRINDLSIDSITRKKDEVSTEIKDVLEIVKEVLNQQTSKSNKKSK